MNRWFRFVFNSRSSPKNPFSALALSIDDIRGIRSASEVTTVWRYRNSTIIIIIIIVTTEA